MLSFPGIKWLHYLYAAITLFFVVFIFIFTFSLVSLILINKISAILFLLILSIFSLACFFSIWLFRLTFYFSPHTINIKEHTVEFLCVIKKYEIEKNTIKNIRRGFGRGKMYNIEIENQNKKLIFKIGDVGFGKNLEPLLQHLSKIEGVDMSYR